MKQVLGAIGLLLTLTSPAALFLAAGRTPFYVVLACGLVMLAVYLVTARSQVRERLARAGFFHGSSALIALLTLAVLIAGNFIVARRGKTWDLTRNKIYSLSAQTISTLKDTKEPVKALVFLQNAASPPAIESIFRRYAEESDKFSFEFKDVNKAPDLVKKYDIRPGQLGVITRGSAEKESHVFLNVERLVAPQAQEQELTNALVKLNGRGQEKVYFLVGHGEPQLELTEGMDERSALKTLGVLKAVLADEGYAPTPLNLAQQPRIPDDASAVVVAMPRGAFPEGEEAIVEKYLSQGGRLLYFPPLSAAPPLAAVLAKYGVQFEPGLVADERSNPGHPYEVVTTSVGDHPITKPLAGEQSVMAFPMARGLTQLHEGLLPDTTVSPLVLSSPNAWLETTPTESPTLDTGERAGQLPLVLAATRNTGALPDKRKDEARIVVFAAGRMATDGLAGTDGNRNLVMNAFAWACSQPQQITIRPPDRDLSTLDITPDMMGGLKFITMYALPVLLLGVGLTIWQTRRAR